MFFRSLRRRPGPTFGAAVALLLASLLAGCASDASRAAAAARDYMSAYKRGDRATVAELTVPSRRERSLDESIERIASGFTGVAEAEVEGNWAIAAARVRLAGYQGAIPFLMRRTDNGWKVATAYPPGLTEIFGSFGEYADRPPDSLKYLPTRRLVSRAWEEDEATTELVPGSPMEMVLATEPSELQTFLSYQPGASEGEVADFTSVAVFKVTVRGFCRVRVTALAMPGTRLRLVLVTPEGGRRASNDRDNDSRGQRFHESDGGAWIEMDISSATYLMAVAATQGTRVRLTCDSTPTEPRAKPTP